MTSENHEDQIVVTHRRYVRHGDAHYGGGLLDGAYVMSLFGDVATELTIKTDGDEGLLASYEKVDFAAPVLVGDVIEAEARMVRRGTRSRSIRFEARVICRAQPDRGPSVSAVLAEPIVVATAVGTTVVPAAAAGRPSATVAQVGGGRS